MADQMLLIAMLLCVVTAFPDKHGVPHTSYSVPVPAPAVLVRQARPQSVVQQPYQFEYEVASAETGDHKSARESRAEDGVVRGEYSYIDPAGTLRTIRYTASDATGFVVQQELVPQFGAPAAAAAASRPQTRSHGYTTKKAGEEGEAAREVAREAAKEVQRQTAKRKQYETEMKRRQDAERQAVKNKEQAQKAEREREVALQAERQKEAALKEEREREAALKAEKEREAALKAEREREAALKAEKEREAALKAEKEREAALQAEREREAALQAEREKERRRRLFGLVPQPVVLVESGPLVLTPRASRPAVTAVRIQGRGIDIAY